MKITCEFKRWGSAVQFASDLLNKAAVVSPSTVTIQLKPQEDFFVVSVTADSDTISLLTGSEPQQSTLKIPLCNRYECYCGRGIRCPEADTKLFKGTF